MAQLDVVIKRALERHYLKRENTWLKQQANATVPQIIGESSKLKEVVEIAERVASTSSTVLLLGESGSGKEVFARWIHHVSPRANAPFVAVNCVALRDELLESELFGHERGAFTGARETRQGKLEVANGGTVFLDEIGDFKLELQAKLLRVLQEREFERVGGNKRIQVDIRVIAATNRDLQKDVQEGRFREDLFFRLNVVAISLPPLRQRTEDIPMLADYFLQRCCRRLGRPLMKFSPAAMNHLLRYQWPGNVRELGNLIERAVILTRNATITPEDLPVLRSTGVDKDDALGASYRDSMREHQRRVIRHALKTSGGNKARAAELLEMQRTYLSRLIRKLKITDNNDSG
jgi:Nif-specific regulatory protein